MAIVHDFKCDECEFIGETWAKSHDEIQDCPECGKNAFKKTFTTFGILQTSIKDSSQSWGSTEKNRTAYGIGRSNKAYNGL